MQAPFNYFGGKARLIPAITAQFPARMDAYVEPFCGSASVFFAAPGRWAENEILNDLNGDIVNFFRVLREQPDELIRRINLTPHSRHEYNSAWHKLKHRTYTNDLDRAHALYIRIMQSYSRTQRANSWTIPPKRGSHNNKAASFLQEATPPRLYACARRLMDASLENYPASKVIVLYDSENTLFYIDPPYLSTHNNKQPYAGLDMSIEQHIALVNQLLSVRGMVVLSGYWHDVYKPLIDDGWLKIEIKTSTQVNTTTKKPKKRTEILFVNPRLHVRKRQLTIFDTIGKTNTLT